MDADAEELESVGGIGSTMADQIRNFFENERNRAVIERLHDRGVEPERTQAETGDELADLTIVFTGSVESWTRDELEALVERHGGDATDSVSGNTDYLVVGENPGETNQEDAEADNVSELAQTNSSTCLRIEASTSNGRTVNDHGVRFAFCCHSTVVDLLGTIRFPRAPPSA
jgi:DNA ligase (NAD+)